MKLSVLICAYRDTQFLGLVLEQIYDRAHEIVIVDGPYEWALEYYSGFPIDLAEPMDDIMFRGRPLRSLEKVRYHHGIWRDELEKRRFGYERCTGDLVLVLDSDELVMLDENALDGFWKSASTVAEFESYGLARTGIQIDWSVSERDAALRNAPVRSRRLFKRADVTPEEHLSYLILVVPNPRPEPGRAMVYSRSFGTAYNLVVMRTRRAHFYKFAFYAALYHTTHGIPNFTLAAGGWRSYAEAGEALGVEELLRVCMRCSTHSIRCPYDRLLVPFHGLPSTFKEALEPLDDAHREFGLLACRDAALVTEIDASFYLPLALRQGGAISLEFEGITAAEVQERVFYLRSDNRERGPVLHRGAFSNGRLDIEIPPLAPHAEDLFERVLVIIPRRSRDERYGWLRAARILGSGVDRSAPEGEPRPFRSRKAPVPGTPG